MRLELLGTVRAWRHGQRVAVGPPKQRALLGFLAGRLNSAVSIEEIADAVWGSVLPRTAENAVHTYVAGLRRSLELPRTQEGTLSALVSTGGGYQLRMNPENVDARSFEHRLTEARGLRARGERELALDLLESALDLWRGEPYTAIPGPFAGVERMRLQELRFAVVEEWAAEMLAMGRHAETVAPLGDLVAKEPLRERLRALLMLSLQGCGRRAHALAVYRESRELLQAELGIEPGQELQTLHHRILTGHPALLTGDGGARSGAGAGSGAGSGPGSGAEGTRTSGAAPVSVGAEASAGSGAPRPAQLLPTARGFVGRGVEARRLRTIMAESCRRPEPGPVIAVVEGAPSVGKSALALRVAHEMADSFPDGHFFVDLCGSSLRRRQLGAKEVLGQVLRSLGVTEARLPEDLEGRTRLYRESLRGTRTLLFLDDAHDLVPLSPLLSEGPACVLVTSRWRPAGRLPIGRLLRVELPPLTPEEAVQLLSCLAGPGRIEGVRREALRLAALCGHLPLPLRIAADALVEHPGLSVAELADSTEGGRLDRLTVVGDAAASLRMSFRKSYRALSPEVGRMFRLLGLHDSREITVEVAATLAGVRPGIAGRQLEVLASAHLLNRTAPDRYSMCDLLRLYAAERAAEDPALSPTRGLSEMLARCGVREEGTPGPPRWAAVRHGAGR
ncbi:BTAD domain-containing putative transcriptional regulator [Streptomyces sp. NPDC020141]|uniref:AfsR/SARP family transcriptional regulator n=1 Tax=Streptomyces sp. NPDC020141 TaxID=3365065 RepID=UPI0037B29AA3